MPKKQQCRTYRYKSLKSWKIDNIDLTQQFSLSIFTHFCYQSVKITWLLSIFYRLTTPGYGQLLAEGDSWTSFCNHVPGSRLRTRRLMAFTDRALHVICGLAWLHQPSCSRRRSPSRHNYLYGYCIESWSECFWKSNWCYNQLQKYLRHCTVFWHKWPVHDLVLVIPPPPLIKVASNTRPYSKLGGTTWNGRGREDSIISHRPVTSSDLKQERLGLRFLLEYLNIFATGFGDSLWARSSHILLT